MSLKKKEEEDCYCNAEPPTNPSLDCMLWYGRARSKTLPPSSSTHHAHPHHHHGKPIKAPGPTHAPPSHPEAF